MAIKFRPYWYDIPGPAIDDPPLFGEERELWLEFADRFWYVGETWVKMLTRWFPEWYVGSEEYEEWKEWMEGKGVFFSAYLNLACFVQRVAFNTPIGEPEEVSQVTGKSLEFYQSLTGLRIPILFDTVGVWSIPTPDMLAARYGWIAFIIAKIPVGYPDWGYSFFTFSEHLTATDWGRWKLIAEWLEKTKEDTGGEPFLQSSKMITRWPDPHTALAAGKRWWAGTMWGPDVPNPVIVLDETYDWPLWYYRF